MTHVAGTPCNARTRAGGRCKKLVRGGGPCRSHGGNTATHRRNRERNLTIAEALAADPRRSPDEVLADVMHQSDWLMRRAREEVQANTPTADTMAKLIGAAESAGRWAKSALDVGLAERQTRVLEQDAAALAGIVTRILGRLNLTADQRALVPTVVPEELRAATQPRVIEGGSS